MLKRDDCIYYAGLIDGEGNIGFRKTRNSWQPKIAVSNANRDVIDTLHREFPRGYLAIRHPKNENQHINYQLSISRYDDCKDLLLLIEPYVKIKKVVASMLLEFISNRKLRTPFTDREKDIIIRIREITNRRGS